MLNLGPGSHAHLIAVCGTAMGSLAGMLRERGLRVTGSDAHVYPPMSTYLEASGIAVQVGFDAAHLEPAPDLVVVGNAVSRGNPEVETTLERRLPYASLPEVLRDLFLRGRRPVVVTGTHGKTTTTALTAHLLARAGLDPSFMVAGLPRDFARPYRLGSGPLFVVEGDEYDSAFFAKHAKFLYYLPEILIVNNIEYDHADIYESLGEIVRAFRQLINLVPRSGLLLANRGDPVLAELLPGSFAPVQTFGLEEEAHWRATGVEVGPAGQSFTVCREGRPWGRVHLRLNGEYNARNALAAIAVAAAAGLSMAQIQDGVASFQGVRRRQELLGTFDDIAVVDDFAHHPTAVGRTLEGLRLAYPGRRLWAVFEPASASNARAVFEDQYLEAFAPADRVLIAKVPRPERARGEAPFSAARLAARLGQQGQWARYLPEPDEILSCLLSEASPGDLVAFMSNAGFGQVQARLCQALQDRHAP